MNNKLSRIIVILLAFMMLFELSACGKEELTYSTGGLEEVSFEESMDEQPDRAVVRGTDPIYQSVTDRLDGTLLTSDFYMYRDTLSEDYKKAYDLLRAGILKCEEVINMTVPVKKEDARTLFQAVLYDSPELFWADCKFRYAINNYGDVTKFLPTYNELAKDLEGNRKKIEEAIAQPLADMWSLDSEIAKVKYAHDYLTNQLSYDLNAPNNQNIYSSFVGKKTVCSGYTRAFQYMMQKMGIPCSYIVGTAGEKHAWNIVKINGEFYSMDVTWDDPINGREGKYYYSYFNITDTEIAKDHTRDAFSALLPVCSGTAMNYKNAFGGNANGTNFASIHGELPEGYGAGGGFLGAPETTPDTTGNPYIAN